MTRPPRPRRRRLAEVAPCGNLEHRAGDATRQCWDCIRQELLEAGWEVHDAIPAEREQAARARAEARQRE